LSSGDCREDFLQRTAFNRNTDVIFVTLQKLSQKKNLPLLKKIADVIDTIVIDEAHKITAPSYKLALEELTTSHKYVIGITATPGRSVVDDKENKLLASIFDYKLLDPIQSLRKMGVLSYIEHKEIETGLNFQIKIDSETDYSKQSLKQISESKARNKKISDIVKEEVSKGKPTLIFSCNTYHSRLLCAYLAVAGVKSAYIDHTQSYSVRKKIIDDFKSGVIDVIINYGVLSTGFDAPRIRTVVISRPTSSVVLYSQMLGRGLRGPKVGGNKECTIIDIVDNLKKHGDQRRVYNYFSEFWSKV